MNTKVTETFNFAGSALGVSHGCQLWDLSSKDVEPFYTAWRKAVRRTYGLPSRTHCVLLPYIVNQMYTIETQIHKRFAQFAVGILKSDNMCLNLCGHLALRGSGSKFCNSLNFIAYKYNFNKMPILTKPFTNFPRLQYGNTVHVNDDYLVHQIFYYVATWIAPASQHWCNHQWPWQNHWRPLLCLVFHLFELYYYCVRLYDRIVCINVCMLLSLYLYLPCVLCTFSTNKDIYIYRNTPA